MRQKAEGLEFSYKRNAMLLQGLIDRTDLFHPMAHLPILSKEETWNGLINLVYDDEPALTDGEHIPYRLWHAELNANIKRGSRVIVARHSSLYDLDVRCSRFLVYYQKGNAPPPPRPGIYTVEEIRNLRTLSSREQECLIIRYNPGDMVYSRWYRDIHRRKNRLAFYLYRRDPFVLNYDQINLADVRFYITCRYERRNYLDMLPTLLEIEQRRTKELAWESNFVKLVAHRLECDETLVWESVEWWKNKVIWKRPIRADDTKALRMIEARVKRQMKQLQKEQT